MTPPDPARGRRYLRAVAVGGSLLSASVVGLDMADPRRPRVTPDTLTFAAVLLAVLLAPCALLSRGIRWPRPLVVGLCWLVAAFFAMLFMMAGGPLLFTASAAARAQGAALVAAVGGYATLARLAGSRHVRAFIAAQRARHDAPRSATGA